MTIVQERARRPGGRSAAVQAKVKRALEDLMRERSRDSISLPMVAERAGVQPSSLYRRWGDIGSLVNEMATYRLDPDRDLPASGDLRADLVAWAGEIVAHYADPVHASMLRAGASTAGDAETDCLRDRRAEATALIASAPTDADVTVDLVLDHVLAPIVYRIIFTPWTLSPEVVPTLVDDLFALARSSR